MEQYSTLYRITMILKIGNMDFVRISPSDIISIAFIKEYDSNTYPITRLRLYSDISILHKLVEQPNDITISCTMDGGIYKLSKTSDNSETGLQLMRSCDSIILNQNCYIENKNIPSSKYDDYVNGIKKDSDLNTSMKVPIELYCFDADLVQRMKLRVDSVYRNMPIESSIKAFLNNNGIHNVEIEPIQNAKKYDQILIPNLSCLDAISYLDTKYGLYKTGGTIFADPGVLRIASTESINGTKSIPIYVDSKESNADTSGMKLVNGNFVMSVQAPNVSVQTETDIERVLNSPLMGAININTNEVSLGMLYKLYQEYLATPSVSMDADSLKTPTEVLEYRRRLSEIQNRASQLLQSMGSVPNLLHKSDSDFLLSTFLARINERITSVDVSGVGFDISKFNLRDRYNLIFKSPIRGIDMSNRYRPRFVNHTLTNMSSDLFVASTTLNLCAN